MKSIQFPISVDYQNKNSSKSISKSIIYYLLLASSFAGGFFLSILFIVFALLIVCGIAYYCVSIYREISTLDFSSDNYSITLAEIIEDLEG